MPVAAEELADLEKTRLEALEAQRRRRQAGEEEEEEEEEGGDGARAAGANGLTTAGAPLPAGGYAARRAKRARAEQWEGEGKRRGGASGDAMEDDFEMSSDEEDSGE